MHVNMNITHKIYDIMPKYVMKPDSKIQKIYMDHKKITKKNNNILEEQRKKDEAKVKKRKGELQHVLK